MEGGDLVKELKEYSSESLLRVLKKEKRMPNDEELEVLTPNDFATLAEFLYQTCRPDAKDFGPYWLENLQGSTAAERKLSSGRYGKDMKQFKQVKLLNRQNQISLFDLLSCKEFPSKISRGAKCSGTAYLEDRLSHLGARYPDVPGLGCYVKGLRVLETNHKLDQNGKSKRVGPQTGKKCFDLLMWISSLEDETSYWKFTLLEKLGKLILNQKDQGKWMQNSTTLLVSLGINEVAFALGSEILGNNPSSIKDSIEKGKHYAKMIQIQFYENTSPYAPKVRRRGYARSSPVRPGSSKKQILEANTSLEYLLETQYLVKSEEGGYDMTEKKVDTEELLFQIFSNSLQAYKLQQDKILEDLHQQKLQSLQKIPNNQKIEKEKNHEQN